MLWCFLYFLIHAPVTVARLPSRAVDGLSVEGQESWRWLPSLDEGVQRAWDASSYQDAFLPKAISLSDAFQKQDVSEDDFSDGVQQAGGGSIEENIDATMNALDSGAAGSSNDNDSMFAPESSLQASESDPLMMKSKSRFFMDIPFWLKRILLKTKFV
eukprot:gnl/MRDRNA2_/MRDRNA2_73090_c0_seq2.p1 gnl/MRDRNA2_/MRDRNA2_73090_c0~~gnl/MRDRNA2_/MRDRNA2_73090_c0_seq2.p1  ORF type:complete len:158 (+),score=37.32 gnl/MRDRNA2_/MRDRNA2_73090_c0_seq2:31-504(+)